MKEYVINEKELNDIVKLYINNGTSSALVGYLAARIPAEEFKNAVELLSENNKYSNEEKKLIIKDLGFNEISNSNISSTSPNNGNAFNILCSELADKLTIENKDYENSFDKSYKEFGMDYYTVIISDKLNRLKTLVSKKEGEELVENKIIIETFLGLAGYSILAIKQLDERFNHKEKE
jgi:hypothetical protein